MPFTEPHLSIRSIASDLQRESEFCVSQRTAYRADLDGLRAIAVLSVIGYHYFGPFFPGGFVGVDIFFVISGYLLSGIIISETYDRRFSFARFYERRIRRIFPALSSLLAICTVFAGMFLVTPDLQSYLQSMLAASWSASNLYFWKNSNYFDSPAAALPLLHTWSLAVEEQFYLIFPIFVFLLSRYAKRYLNAAIVAVAVVSFGVSVITVRSDQAGAFYLPWGRAWELLLGAVIFLRLVPPLRSRILNECVAFCGILLLGFSVFKYTLNTRFPGEHALVPCLGAAAVIYVGQTTLTAVHRSLMARPLVFIGLISYSLYLWHWPLLVFSRISILPGPSLPLLEQRLVLTFTATGLATVSWLFVETPFRAGKRRPRRRSVYLFGAVCLATVSVSVLLAKSWAPRLRTFPRAADDIGSYIDYPIRHSAEFHALFADGPCFLDRWQPVSSFQEERCLSSQHGEPGVLLFGDSEAANLRYGLARSFPGVQILEATSSACPPLVKTVIPTTAECRDFIRAVMTKFIPKYKIETVLLSAGWVPADKENLAATIGKLKGSGIRVLVFGPLPQYGTALPRLLAQSISYGKTNYARENRQTNLDDLDRELSLRAAREWHVPYVSLSELLCPRQECVEFVDGKEPIQFDHVHLTLPGSILVGRRVAGKYPYLFRAETQVGLPRSEFGP